ncbi:MAG: PaaI family thioesterase [Ktedonobacteraceae bacterium]
MTQAEEPLMTLEDIQANVQRSGYFQLIGMHLEKSNDGVGEVRIKVDARLMHPQQIVHGGVIFTLADTAMSMALISVLPLGTRFSTIEAKINYIAPVVTGELSAEGVILHRGRSTAVTESTVYNLKGEEKVIVARVLGTFYISASKPSQFQQEQ